MGSVLLSIVARPRRDKPLLIDSYNNTSAKVDLGECAFRGKEALLLETPPLGIRHKKTIFKPELLTKAAKIGKLARISDRKTEDEGKVIYEVSQAPVRLSTTSECAAIKEKKLRRLKWKEVHEYWVISVMWIGVITPFNKIKRGVSALLCYKLGSFITFVTCPQPKRRWLNMNQSLVYRTSSCGKSNLASEKWGWKGNECLALMRRRCASSSSCLNVISSRLHKFGSSCSEDLLKTWHARCHDAVQLQILLAKTELKAKKTNFWLRIAGRSTERVYVNECFPDELWSQEPVEWTDSRSTPTM